MALNSPTGVYGATVIITAGSQVQTVAVTLNINALLSVPPTIVFGGIAGASAPSEAQDSQLLTVTPIGAPVRFNYSISSGAILPIGAPSCATSSVTEPTELVPPTWLLSNGISFPALEPPDRP